jgi:hypothetical protein
MGKNNGAGREGKVQKTRFGSTNRVRATSRFAALGRRASKKLTARPGSGGDFLPLLNFSTLNCNEMLKGNTYCLSSELLTRPSVSTLVRKHGGKIVTYLSGKVCILIVKFQYRSQLINGSKKTETLGQKFIFSKNYFFSPNSVFLKLRLHLHHLFHDSMR